MYVWFTALSVPQLIHSVTDKTITNNELDMMWKEAMVAQSKVLSWHLHGGTEENNENPQLG
jgi:hypothetical protein